MLPLLLRLVPPIGQSSIYPIQKLHVCPHTWQRPLSWGLIAANGVEDKVDQEPRPSSEHQIVWTVPNNCRPGGIRGMHYFSQMRWSVSFFVFFKLPDHVHNHLVGSLYQSHFMPRILHISSIPLLVKLAPLSLKNLAGAPKIDM